MKNWLKFSSEIYHGCLIICLFKKIKALLYFKSLSYYQLQRSYEIKIKCSLLEQKIIK